VFKKSKFVYKKLLYKQKRFFNIDFQGSYDTFVLAISVFFKHPDKLSSRKHSFKKYDNFKMFVIVKPIKQTKISLKLKCYFEIKKILKYIYADRFIFFTLVLLNMFQKELK